MGSARGRSQAWTRLEGPQTQAAHPLASPPTHKRTPSTARSASRDRPTQTHAGPGPASLKGSWNLPWGCSTKVSLKGETILQGMEEASVQGAEMLAWPPPAPHGCQVWADRDGSCSSRQPGDPAGARYSGCLRKTD